MPRTVSFDFTGVPDGTNFPSVLGVGVVKETTGIYDVVEEASPATYFSTQDEKALFNYYEEIIGASRFVHGFLCSPGTLDGNDAALSVLFSDPLAHFNSMLDEFRLIIAMGFRGENRSKDWIGGILEASYTFAGGWNPQRRISVVRTEGDNYIVEESNANVQTFKELNELSVRVEGNKVLVAINGISKVQKDNLLSPKGNSFVLQVSCRSKSGVTWTNYPIIQKIDGQSLRSGRKKEMKQIPNNNLPSPIYPHNTFKVPVRELIDDKKLVQVSERKWRFLEDVLVEPPEAFPFKATAGSEIISHFGDLNDARFVACHFRYD